MKTDQLDQAAVTGLKFTLGGFLTTTVGNLSSEDLFTFGGFLVSVAGFVVLLYFKIRSDRRQQVLFELRKRRLEKGMTDHSSLDEDE